MKIKAQKQLTVAFIIQLQLSGCSFSSVVSGASSALFNQREKVEHRAMEVGEEE